MRPPPHFNRYSWFGGRQLGAVDPTAFLRLETVVRTDSSGDVYYACRVTALAVVTSSNVTRLSGSIQVSDGVNQPDVAVLNVDIVDVNDHSPTFDVAVHATECIDTPSCTVRRGPIVSEDIASTVVLYSFSATDADFGGNGQVSFATTTSDAFGLTCDNSAGLFAIDQTGVRGADGRFRGNLTVAVGRNLDFETQSTYATPALFPPLGLPAHRHLFCLQLRSHRRVSFAYSCGRTDA
jgi:hypothetical protein